MKQFLKIISLVLAAFAGSWSLVFGATVLTTATSDTLETFRTNVNTSLTNLNTDLVAGTGLIKVSTSSSETQGQLPYWTTTSATPALLGKVATTTVTFTSFPANLSGTLGTLVGGANTTWTYWGLATTSQPASSNLLVSNGAAGVYGVATTSETCTSPLSCTAHGVLTGGGAITLGTVTVDKGGTGQVSFTSSQLLYGNSTNALTSVATTTQSFSGPFTVTGPQGALVGGSNSTITWSGLATSTAIAANQVLYGTSASGVGSEAAFTYNSATDLLTVTAATTTQISAASQNFYVDSNGKITGRDTTNAWNATVSPTHSFVLGTGTTTTWTASTTGTAYSPFVISPFTGTLRQVRCATDASFVGVNVQVNGSDATPSYFVASTTVGKVGFTSGNSVTVGQKILANFGTTTTATSKEVNCTFDITES